MHDCLTVQKLQAFEALPKDASEPILTHPNRLIVSPFCNLRQVSPEVWLIHEIEELAVLEHLVRLRDVRVAQLCHQGILSHNCLQLILVAVLLAVKLDAIPLRIPKRTEVHDALATAAKLPVNGVASFSQAHVGYIAGKLCATPLLSFLPEDGPEHCCTLLLVQRAASVEVEALANLIDLAECCIWDFQIACYLRCHLDNLGRSDCLAAVTCDRSCILAEVLVDGMVGTQIRQLSQALVERLHRQLLLPGRQLFVVLGVFLWAAFAVAVGLLFIAGFVAAR
mmetsp:Transcript_18569/g.43673  ORF Transcript_18569/g.43673 Transcript_18569/m.43673 type:complete len:281 (+) Transcript_18569:1038-1880(+)